jgi:4'-phosphopantetheinyl transferase EntD
VTRPAGLLLSVLPPHAIGVEAEPGDWDAPLLPAEAPMVARAVERRRREVAAGRACARRALGRLGAAVVALPPGPDRVPRWPDGVVGSITHTDGYCAAAVAWQRHLRSLGLDVERPIEASRADVIRLVTTPGEAEWLAALAAPSRALAAGLVFSAKEALYKCQYPLTREPLEFGDVELLVAMRDADLVPGATGSLAARFRSGTAASDLGALALRYALAGDLVATAAFLAA